jgi:hypothetical protein
MGIVQVPAPVAGITRSTLVFTSSQTWTVPSSAQVVDVMVVGGGGGADGGYRSSGNAESGAGGGAITVAKNLNLTGVSTVSIVVGAGGAGGAGSVTTSRTLGGAGGYSGFGDYCYSQGGLRTTGGSPSIKSTTDWSGEGTLSNFAPMMVTLNATSATSGNRTSASPGLGGIAFGVEVYGLAGGRSASGQKGSYPGGATTNSDTAYASVVNGLPWGASNSFIGAPTAGAASASGAAGGAAGVTGGFSGGGGGVPLGSSVAGQSGGPGAGGSGGTGSSNNGGNGGNGGTNSGGGGGGGGMTGSTGAGTGGAGGNGGSGFVVVSWIS